MTETQHHLKTTTTAQAPPATPKRSYRKHAIAAGAFFLLTDITSILAFFAYEPLLQHADFVASTGASDLSVRVGAFLEVLLTIGIVGTALSLYPILKQQNKTVALGYVVGRAWEAAIITVGIISLLAIVTLRSGFAPGEHDAGTYTAIAKSLLAVHDWTFLFGPHIVLSLNAIMLGYLLVTSKLVPRWIGLLALVDGPLLFLWSVAMLFGASSSASPFAIALGLPMLAFEVSLAVWLIVKGFQPRALAALEPRAG